MASTSSVNSVRLAPIAVAMDAPSLGVIAAWTAQVAGVVSTVKIGLEVFCRDGAVAVVTARRAAAEAGHPDIDIFLDLKLHDIPATVRGAAAAVAPLRPAYLTVHASGGGDMVAAAVEALPGTWVAAVTVLTSLDAEALDAVGLVGPPGAAAVRLACLAVDAGARAIVCSPHEVAAVRAAVGPHIRLITPGVRPAGTSTDDQKRVATPALAIAEGADLLVIGRPITGASDVRSAALAIAAGLT